MRRARCRRDIHEPSSPLSSAPTHTSTPIGNHLEGIMSSLRWVTCPGPARDQSTRHRHPNLQPRPSASGAGMEMGGGRAERSAYFRRPIPSCPFPIRTPRRDTPRTRGPGPPRLSVPACPQTGCERSRRGMTYMNCDDHVGSGGNLPGAAAARDITSSGGLFPLSPLVLGLHRGPYQTGRGVGGWVRGEEIPGLPDLLSLGPTYRGVVGVRRAGVRHRYMLVVTKAVQIGPGISRISNREKGALKDQRQVRLLSGFCSPQDVIIHIHSGASQAYAMSSVWICGCK
jgi:hypothetical protein